jgi:hypothetical protein
MRLKAVVRWESAAPIREASKRLFPSDPSGSYVIAVSGLMPGGNARRENMDRQQERLSGLREVTVLQCKGRDPIAPVHIDEVAADGTLLFYFPADAGPISLDDKEVVFRTTLGPMELKARFVTREMKYRGSLEL